MLVLDNLSNGHRELIEQGLQVKLIVGDINDRPLLDRVFATYPITAVMHFAAYIAVGESVADPSKYAEVSFTSNCSHTRFGSKELT